MPLTWPRSSRPRKAAMSSTVVSSRTSWFGFARPSDLTAVASPHTRPQPLEANRCHRRRTRSVGRPSVVASHPSIGSTAKRFGDTSASPPPSLTTTGDASEPTSSTASAIGISTPSRSQCSRNALDRVELLDLGVANTHAAFSHSCTRSRMSASTARSASGRRGTTAGVPSHWAQPRSSNQIAASCR